MFLFWWGIVVGFGLCGSGGVLGAYYAELFPERVLATGIKFNPATTGCDKISLTYKMPFHILHP